MQNTARRFREVNIRERLRFMEETVRKPNIHLTRILEGEVTADTIEIIFEEIMTYTFAEPMNGINSHTGKA